MAETRYKLLFRGGVRAGHTESAVKQKLGELLKLDDRGLAQMFSGRLITLKRDLEQAEANKYQQVLEKFGAEILLQLDAEQQAQPREDAVAPAAATEAKNDPQHIAAVAEEVTVGQTLACPRCGHNQPVAEQCCHCKMDLRRHILRLERKAKAQQLRSSSSPRSAA